MSKANLRYIDNLEKNLKEKNRQLSQLRGELGRYKRAIRALQKLYALEVDEIIAHYKIGQRRSNRQ